MNYFKKVRLYRKQESYSVSFYLIESSDKIHLSTLSEGTLPVDRLQPYHTTAGGSPALFDGFVKFLYVVGKSKTQG